MAKTTPATPAAAPVTTDYQVTSRLAHDGETFEPGATVSLTDAQAAPLLGGCIAVPQALAGDVDNAGSSGAGATGISDDGA